MFTTSSAGSQNNPYTSPAQVDEHSHKFPTHQKMTILQTLFSFQGRIPRRVFWGASLGMGFIFYVIVFALVLILGDKSVVTGIVTLLLYIPLIWASLALAVKRWQDRGKSGLWVLIGLIPLIGPIWAFVETGCLRGTQGANQYGADPT